MHIKSVHGIFCQVSDDDFCLPQPEEQRSYRGTIALKVSKRKPKPTQKILDMEAELLTKARQERMEEVRGKVEKIDLDFLQS